MTIASRRVSVDGSANILTVPQISESLAGRMEIVGLLPSHALKIGGKRLDFLRAAFDGKLGKPAGAMIGENLVQAVVIGGYPRNAAARRSKAAPDIGRGIT